MFKKLETTQIEFLWLLAILAAGLLMRGTALVAFNHTPESDETAYISIAKNIVTGNGVLDGEGNLAFYNAGYPMFVLSPIYYIFGESLTAARMANLALGGIAIILCYLISKEAGAGRLGRLFAPAVWALYLPASVYGVYLLKENLMTPLMLAVMWCALRLHTQPSMKVATVCGILFGVLAVTGNSALVLVAPVVLASYWLPTPVWQRLKVMMFIVAVALVTSAPWLIRNAEVLGAPVLNTNGGFNLYLGNNPAATGMFVSIADTPRGPSWHALRAAGELQAAEVLKREAIDWIKDHPGEFVKLALKKAVYFWAPPFHEGKYEVSKAEVLVRIMWAMQYIAIIGLALTALVIRQLRCRKTALLWSAIVCYAAVHILFLVAPRYREPIIPMLAVIAAISAEHIYRRIRFRWIVRDAKA